MAGFDLSFDADDEAPAPSNRVRNNLLAVLVVVLLLCTLLLTGCTTDWRDCTYPAQVYRDEVRKFGLCEIDRRVPQRDLRKFD